MSWMMTMLAADFTMVLLLFHGPSQTWTPPKEPTRLMRQHGAGQAGELELEVLSVVSANCSASS